MSLLVIALGLAQIVSWGSLYYSFSLFVDPLTQTFGWSRTEINGALTLGLVIAGLSAYPVGVIIHRFGGRGVMTIGSLLAVAMLFAFSQINSLGALYAVWCGIGLSMAMVLYEPVFIVLNQHFDAHSRRAITQLTLVAGFASTVYMPLIEILLNQMSWRSVLQCLALGVGLITVPVHALLIPKKPNELPASSGSIALSIAPIYFRDPVFWCLTLWFVCWSATASGLMFQLVPYLRAEAVSSSDILLAVAIVGPMQVAGRAALMLAGERISSASIGCWTHVLTAAALMVLASHTLGPLPLLVVGAMFGFANGITTILRGAVPGEWLGRAHIGKLMGLMATPMMLSAALAPLATAWIWQTSGDPQLMLWALVGITAIGFVAYGAALKLRRNQS